MSSGPDLQHWNQSSTLNGTSDPFINWQEGMPRADVNDSARAMMSAIASHREFLNGSIQSSGTPNAQIVSTTLNYPVLPPGLRLKVKVGAGLTNTGPMTLTVDGITSSVSTQRGSSLASGMWEQGTYVDILYNGSNWVLQYILNQQIPVAPPQVNVFTSGSGVYMTPVGAIWMEVQILAGGGGGAGGGSGAGAGSYGGPSQFGNGSVAGGSNGGDLAAANYANCTYGVLGGPGAGGNISPAGSDGIAAAGGHGAASVFGAGGHGAYSAAGNVAYVNGAGGGGGGVNGTAVQASGGGGGAGAYGVIRYLTPGGSYNYLVGAGGTGGNAGSNGYAGGNGSPGLVIVTCYFAP